MKYNHPVADYQDQVELEDESRGLGIKKYREKVETSDPADLPPGIRMMQLCIEPMADSITEWMESKGANRNGALKKFIRDFDGDHKSVAFIVLRNALGAISKRTNLTAAAGNIAGALEDELQYRHLKENHKGLYIKLQEQMKSQGINARRRHTVVTHTVNKFDISMPRWGTERIQLSVRLIKMAAEVTGMFELKRNLISKKNTPYILVLTERGKEWFENAHARCELLDPLHLPMVVPPNDWKGITGGGYLTERGVLTKLIKSRNLNYLEELQNRHMPEVYDSINALQKTSWRINKGVYKVLRECWEMGGNLGKIPAREAIELPAFPADGDTNKVAKTAWKRKASEIHALNHRLQAKRFGVSQKLWTAEKFMDRERIYFVYTMDWRGRVYPMSSYVNPQADDSGKALLQFAEGKKLGAHGAYWLAVHIANCFGVDKVSLNDRVEWVQQNEELILDSAINPLEGQRFWTEADKPFCALAACFEWLGYNIEGNDYVSHLPVAMDGSCNGLQNLSAMLRDEVGGKAVNLVPGEAPNDIYQTVCDAVVKKIDACAKQPFDSLADGAELDEWNLAGAWMGKVTRKIVKRPVMTLPYGAGRYGMRGQIFGELQKMADDEGIDYLGPEVDGFQASAYLAGVVYDAIGEVVIAARQAMDWLQDTARVASKDGLPIHWTTPVGFPVMQEYKDTKTAEIQIAMGSQRMRLKLKQEEEALDKRRMAQGISPNFVHSMDASHLMMTINLCTEAGIDALAMVHDSYGTHAADADDLAYLLRQAFVDQYSMDTLGILKEEIESQLEPKLAKKIPELPGTGSLNLDDVMRSDYFFA